MADESLENKNGEATLKEFVDQTLRDYERTREEQKEIDLLVKQSTAEVERLAERNTRVANYVRQLHTNFDTVPREDIKEGYEALINAQQRLFTMRGQLEKLQSDQRYLNKLSELQRQVLEMTEGLVDTPVAAHRSRDNLNIIRVIQTEEAARQSLVRRMHDGPASSLSNFILQAEICEKFFEVDPERAKDELGALKRSATNTFGEVKGFIFDLRPMMLDDLGVAPTLRRYIESLEEKYRLPIVLTVTGPMRRLPGHVEVAIFRAVQELINNARVHGQASEIQVLLDLDDEQVHVAVEDNGGGFNADEVVEGDGGRSALGLPALHDRIEMLGGQFELRSTIGEGTRAEFTIPVEPERDLLVAM